MGNYLDAGLEEVAEAVRHLVAEHGMGEGEWHDMSPNHLIAFHDLKHATRAPMAVEAPGQPLKGNADG